MICKWLASAKGETGAGDSLKNHLHEKRIDPESKNNRLSQQTRFLFSAMWMIEIVYSVSSLFEFQQNQFVFVNGILLWWRILCIPLLVGMQIAYQKKLRETTPDPQ